MNSEDESDTSSPHSPSAPASPAASLHAPPSVQRLVHFFAAAKRSLTASNYVFRANELVKSSRALVEEIAVLNARNTFARRAVDEQVDTLYAFKHGLSKAGDDADQHFHATIERLDLANDRLEKTLNALKKTTVDSSLYAAPSLPSNSSGGIDNGDATDPPLPNEKTLYDFVDETNHADLQTSLRALIDSYQDSCADLNDTVTKLGESLKAINAILSGDERVDKSPDLGTIYDEPPLSIPQMFHGMEDHAAEMATLLQSLVSHYDLCVSALKHTEGGGEAARRAIQQADEALAKNSADTVEESLYLKTIPEPISNLQRSEMLRVLEADAQEVEDVVGEIKDRHRDQEGLYDQLLRHAKSARSMDERLRQVLELLHEMKDLHLPSHLHAMTTFKSSWRRIQTSIESQTAELASLSAFYDGFLSGYASLLREVERRKEAKKQMRKVADRANKELLRLDEADRNMRQDFMEDTGKFLPQGIWNGLADDGVRWELREVGREAE